MDLRREQRFAVDQPVTVTILTDGERAYQATIKNGSGLGLALEMPVPVTPGAALKIILGDTMLLGDAIYCGPQRNAYLIGVLLESQLTELSRLGRILREFAVGSDREQARV